MQIIVFDGMEWDFDVRFRKLAHTSGPEASAVHKEFTVDGAQIGVNAGNSAVGLTDFLYCTVFNNFDP